MFDWREINKRFLSFFQGQTQYEIAEHHGVSQPTVNEWVNGIQQIPWKRLKELVDIHQISWDWLLEGQGPKERRATTNPMEMGTGVFDTPGINQRFLAFFCNMTQKEMAAYFEVTQPAVSGWKNFDRQIPWEKLKMVADIKSVSWEWLLEGIEPKFRT